MWPKSNKIWAGDLLCWPGPSRAYIEWDDPEQPNGRMTMYAVYVSVDPSTDGIEVYNSTEPLIHFCTIDTLSPGTLYFFKLLVMIACLAKVRSGGVR